MRGFAIALLLIYALLAIPFRSYSQPLIVMSAIPFGLVGAVWGHVIMGLDLTILSMFGLVALHRRGGQLQFGHCGLCQSQSRSGCDDHESAARCRRRALPAAHLDFADDLCGPDAVVDG